MNTIQKFPLRIPKTADWSGRRVRIWLALAVAAVSDVLAFFAELILPLQWALDLVTALLLFLILGRRWAILPGLVAEAIPGMGVFPAWILVVLSIVVYDDIRRPRPKA